jgi:hypothetical protein
MRNCRSCPWGRINAATQQVECTYFNGCVQDEEEE